MQLPDNVMRSLIASQVDWETPRATCTISRSDLHFQLHDAIVYMSVYIQNISIHPGNAIYPTRLLDIPLQDTVHTGM